MFLAQILFKTFQLDSFDLSKTSITISIKNYATFHAFPVRQSPPSVSRPRFEPRSSDVFRDQLSAGPIGPRPFCPGGICPQLEGRPPGRAAEGGPRSQAFVEGCDQVFKSIKIALDILHRGNICLEKLIQTPVLAYTVKCRL